jgi:hypothetical protein
MMSDSYGALRYRYLLELWAIAYLLDDERAIATGFTLNVSITLLARGTGLVSGF